MNIVDGGNCSMSGQIMQFSWQRDDSKLKFREIQWIYTIFMSPLQKYIQRITEKILKYGNSSRVVGAVVFQHAQNKLE